MDSAEPTERPDDPRRPGAKTGSPVRVRELAAAYGSVGVEAEVAAGKMRGTITHLTTTRDGIKHSVAVLYAD